MSTNDALKWAYLAGFIDGEGNISIWHGFEKLKPKSKRTEPYEHFASRISVVNTDIIVIDWILENFGNKVLKRDRKVKRIHKPAYVWYTNTKQGMKEILTGVEPFLIVKKRQAQIALEYLELDGKHVSRRRELMEQIQLLNRKGISPETNTSGTSEHEVKIESELIGDYERVPVVISGTERQNSAA